MAELKMVIPQVGRWRKLDDSHSINQDGFPPDRESPCRGWKGRIVGVAHCGGGAGPAPTGQLEALLSWVEDGKAPDTLSAARRDQLGAVTRSRPICQYPLVAKYKGAGSTDEAANFVCSTGF